MLRIEGLRALVISGALKKRNPRNPDPIMILRGLDKNRAGEFYYSGYSLQDGLYWVWCMEEDRFIPGSGNWWSDTPKFRESLEIWAPRSPLIVKLHELTQ